MVLLCVAKCTADDVVVSVKYIIVNQVLSVCCISLKLDVSIYYFDID